ncbi:MAG: MFS transporter [Erythrobacter sp.]|nr:MFS transporter [Erythrobacter sp.]
MKAGAGSATARPWPAQRLAWTALAILALANILSYLDRIVINLLVEPIQADLAISDTQFGLLQGVAFGLFYTAMALPIGRLVDNGPRKPIIAIGVTVFSLFTLASGLARNFAQMFVARIGVGAGEASVVPTAYSIISDMFPPEKLGRAMSVFTMTAFVGIGLAYIAGGVAIAAVAAWDAPGFLGELAPWRRTFLLVAAPGLFVAVLLLALKEPERRGGEGRAKIPMREVAAHLRGQRRALVLVFAGFSMITLSGYASTVWTPALFIRAFGWSAGEIGVAYGALYLMLGPAGALFAGWLCDRMTAAGSRDAPLKVAAWGYLGTGLFGGLAPLMPTGELALAVFAPAMLMSTMPYPMAGTAIQLITPGRMRGQVSALYMLVINLVGLGAGPLVVGVFNDALFTGPEGVRYSLAWVNAVCAPFAFVLLWAAFRPYRELGREA